MRLASIISRYDAPFRAKYAERLLPGHRRAMAAMTRCRTPDAGEVLWRCVQCAEPRREPRSCGHRACPQCQNHEATVWLERQRAKRLPVPYFMATFTLPVQLRPLAWRHQRTVYAALLATAAATLKDFALNPYNLGADLGMTAILHTHSRRLDFHPHCHVVVPGGGVDRTRRQWRTVKGKYLFNAFALAKVFRARFLAAMAAEGLAIPREVPEKWTVHCTHVGNGEPALAYLSRYLYRGVIGERQIVAEGEGKVTFTYVESATGQTKRRTLAGEDFVWLVLQHVLPRGFRRVRDYGFLHGNAKRLLALVHLVLRVVIEAKAPRPRPMLRCPRCQAPMRPHGFSRAAWESG